MDRDESRARAASTSEEIDRLRDQLLALGAGEARARESLGAKGARLAALNAAEAELTQKMGRTQTQLARLLGALELYRRNPPPALLVSPRSATDAVNAAILLKALEPDLEARAKAFAKEAETLRALRRRIVLANGDIFAEESEAQDRRTQIERLIAQKSALERSLSGDAQAADAEVRRLADQAKSLGVRPEDLEGAELPARMGPPVPGPPLRRFRDPAPGGRRSEGWVWRTDAGAEVRAPADGRVDYAGVLKGWGVVLILRLPQDYHLVIAGLSASSAQIGGAVVLGEPIGRMAATSGLNEDKTAPELYLELRKGETPVDPGRWLGRPATGRS